MVTLEFTAHSWDRQPERESSDGAEDGSEDADASDNRCESSGLPSSGTRSEGLTRRDAGYAKETFRPVSN